MDRIVKIEFPVCPWKKMLLNEDYKRNMKINLKPQRNFVKILFKVHGGFSFQRNNNTRLTTKCK